MHHSSSSSPPPPKPKKQLATHRSTRSTGSTSQSQKKYIVYNLLLPLVRFNLVGYRKAQEESDDPQISEEENIPAMEVETLTLTPKKKGVK